MFLLWDGAFASVRKIDPTMEDAENYEQFIDAAVAGHVQLGLTITPKVHLMLKHVRWQMEKIDRGLVNKMDEDWVEKQHQMGKRERLHFCTLNNLQHRTNARAQVAHRNSNPLVVSQMLKVDGASKRKFNGERGKKRELRHRVRWAKGATLMM